MDDMMLLLLYGVIMVGGMLPILYGVFLWVLGCFHFFIECVYG